MYSRYYLFVYKITTAIPMSKGEKINQPSSSGKNLEVIEFLSDFLFLLSGDGIRSFTV